jgi:glycosyltransferase involved in cell wall biosynthesis
VLPTGDPARDLVSIIVPARDEGTRLARTLQGVLADPLYPHFEIIVLDDGSSEPVLFDDPRVRILRAERPRGELAVRRWGVEVARGSILQFLDAHVRVSPGWLLNLYLALRRRNFRALIGPLLATLDEASWSLTGEVSYGWSGGERFYGSRHLQRRETGADGLVPAFSNHSFMVARAVHEELGGFCSLFQGQGSFEVEYCRRAARFGVRSYLELTSLLGHVYKLSYTDPVTWEQMVFHNLLIAYLDGGEDGLEAARAACAGQPGVEEGWRRFVAVRPHCEPWRGGTLPTAAAPQRVLVSVVIAAHNEGSNVRKTVENLMHQHAELDLALVDDGSDDGSFAFLDELPYRSDPRIQRFRFEESVGCVRARHQGVLLARGDAVLFLDAHMALFPDAIEVLAAALQRAGPLAAVVPEVAILDADSWEIGPPTGQVFAIDERLNFVWNSERPPGPLASVGGGCCVLMRKALYEQTGGLDLGLRRWGSEFTDLVFKVYNVGGFCYLESDVRVGHLFRTVFPYAMSHGEVAYNKLRTAYVHFSRAVFARFEELTRDDPGMEQARAWRAEDQADWDARRAVQVARAQRDPDWYVQTFLPGLLEG